VDSSSEDVVKAVMAATDGKGCDTVVEAVGIPETFELCQQILADGGVLANVGVHGGKADLHLEDLWAKNISKQIFVFCAYLDNDMNADNLNSNRYNHQTRRHGVDLDAAQACRVGQARAGEVDHAQ
jgi:threonine dehydrogenase-like Zn-dependent dehydrogenase